MFCSFVCVFAAFLGPHHGAVIQVATPAGLLGAPANQKAALSLTLTARAVPVTANATERPAPLHQRYKPWAKIKAQYVPQSTPGNVSTSQL